MEGNDLTIARATEAGEMEFNVNIPIVLACLFENLNFIRRAVRTLREKCLEGLEVYGVSDMSDFDDYILTILEPKLGSNLCQEINHIAASSNMKVVDVLLEKKLISEEELEYFRKHKVLTKTGIISLDKTE